MPAWIRWGLRSICHMAIQKVMARVLPHRSGTKLAITSAGTASEHLMNSTQIHLVLQRLGTWEVIGENAVQNSTKNKRREIGKDAWAARESKAVRPRAIGKVKHGEGMQRAVGMFRRSGSQPKVKWKSCEDQMTKGRMAMQPQHAWLGNCRNLTKHAILFIPSQPLSHR